MFRTMIGLTFAALLTAGSVWALDEEKDQKEITAKDVMTKVNRKGGLAVVANRELKAEKPDWDKISGRRESDHPFGRSVGEDEAGAAQRARSEMGRDDKSLRRRRERF